MRLSSAWLALGMCLLLHPNGNFDLAQGANILGVFPYHYGSAFLVVRPWIEALLKRGHRVTLITPDEITPDIEGVRHIRVNKLRKHAREFVETHQIVDFLSNKWKEASLAATIYFNITHDILSDDGVQKLLSDKSERFDLILMDASNLDALYGLVEYYNATLIGLTSTSINWFIEELAGNPAPSLNEPISQIGYSRDYSIVSRIRNWLHINEEKLMEYLIILPAQLRVFKKFFGYSTEKFYELRGRFSLILVNNHFSLGKVRSNVPNLIEVGGIHLSQRPEPCDESLQKFMDDAEHGVIYFSLGQDIMQRVVWKNELFKMPNISDNIYALDAVPQRQILAHSNVRLFITNGGLLSVIEAVDSGVPILGLPVFFDQFNNLRRAQLKGMAEVLDINQLDVDTLVKTIIELIENPKYALNANKISMTFKDRPMSPLDTAVWWTEYALRNRDISHIRLDVEEIPLIHYYRIDSILTLFLRFVLIAGSVIFLVAVCLKTYMSLGLGYRLHFNLSIK
ncbi:UDP-glycosyltransferase UGT5-like isoform X2 [Drosophila teissieri]|uniref:UDP-glycosyltransferase UGT5-like isoform X2 n=1 Tax=Drosophila teissieri TaxID=7243 RepID=UPI001CBA3F15|nr:UDP-glycosyltransferase UGT5-like isoform X2 [Drosophila teissieri]